jgi:hypothetical protein
MIKRWLLLVPLLTVAVSAQGADFRLLDFGDSCEGIVAREAGQGSRLQSHEHNMYKFSGNYRGRPATISYECRQGHFDRGVIIFRFKDFAAAKQFFNQQKGDYIAYYGAPDLDQSSAAYLKYMKSIGIEVEEQHQYLLGWERADKNILFGASRTTDGSGAVVTLDIIPHRE